MCYGGGVWEFHVLCSSKVPFSQLSNFLGQVNYHHSETPDFFFYLFSSYNKPKFSLPGFLFPHEFPLAFPGRSTVICKYLSVPLDEAQCCLPHVRLALLDPRKKISGSACFALETELFPHFVFQEKSLKMIKFVYCRT